jgi:hypothetical protein
MHSRLTAFRKALGFLYVVLILGNMRAYAADLVTKEYWLKNMDTQMMIRILNIAVKNPAGYRIMGGQGKHLVVTDSLDQQSQIAEYISLFDQPSTETDPDKIIMNAMMRVSRYVREKKQLEASMKVSGDTRRGAPAPRVIFSGVNSYDVKISTWSVYAEEDAKLVRQPRHIQDEALLPTLSDLTLKGIFKSNEGAPMALLSYGDAMFTARDGGLFERNRSRVKDVKTQVLKDRVTLVGPDRIPREIRFKTSL